MPGQIKQMIESLIQQRAKGDPTILLTTSTRLKLKGLNPDHFNTVSPDDPAVLAQVRAIAAEWGIQL